MEGIRKQREELARASLVVSDSLLADQTVQIAPIFSETRV